MGIHTRFVLHIAITITVIITIIITIIIAIIVAIIVATSFHITFTHILSIIILSSALLLLLLLLLLRLILLLTPRVSFIHFRFVLQIIPTPTVLPFIIGFRGTVGFRRFALVPAWFSHPRGENCVWIIKKIFRHKRRAIHSNDLFLRHTLGFLIYISRQLSQKPGKNSLLKKIP